MDQLVLADNSTFMVTNWLGDATAGDGLGLYRNDMRHLSHYELVPVGWTPERMGVSVNRNSVATLQLANSAFVLEDGRTILPHTISLRRNRALSGAFVERIGLQSYNAEPVPVALDLLIAADFRDMFDIRGFVRGRRGTLADPEIRPHEVAFAYQGADGVLRRTRVRFDRRPIDIRVELPSAASAVPAVRYPDQSQPAPPVTEVTPYVRLRFAFELRLDEAQWVTIDVVPEQNDEAVEPPSIEDAARRQIARYSAWEASATLVRTDHDGFDRLIERSLLDLRSLTHDTPDGPFPNAGIPWFAAPFGRDSIITSFQTLAFLPDLAKGTLRFLARRQGRRIDRWRDEEPGKILHELRVGEMANLGETPHSPYYGSIDSTPLFLILFAETLDWTHDEALAEELLPNVERALEWIDRYGDRDGDGYVEYVSSTEAGGLRNQGWKDSDDAIAHEDGSLAEGPIALVEVQAYVVDAKRRLAEFYCRRGDRRRGETLAREAEDLAERIRRDFALGDGAYAIALDGRKRPVRAVGSNMGHLLFARVLPPEEAAQCVERLLQRDLDAGWGIRTLSKHHRRYNPMSYHNGSIWPHDNSLIAYGMKRYGFDEAANRVVWGFIEAGLNLPEQRLPELYCGFQRDALYVSLPAQYPVSCAPQAWAAGSALLALRTILGLTPTPSGLRLRPRLPLWLREVRVSRLRVGGASLDLAVNDRNEVTINALRGGLAISVE
jgi:glycogen debranching enzyme